MYIESRWDAFQPNYTHGKYQFAFLAYHMLRMSFIYSDIWQIRQTEPEDFARGLIGFAREEKALLEATSPFVFSTVNWLSAALASCRLFQPLQYPHSSKGGGPNPLLPSTNPKLR
ncbi:MAG TPA: hypothetical protein VHS28_01710 [Chloroflexota bacterium]|nr:hypothetical protein [Chloroflexota bacterium]